MSLELEIKLNKLEKWLDKEEEFLKTKKGKELMKKKWFKGTVKERDKEWWKEFKVFYGRALKEIVKPLADELVLERLRKENKKISDFSSEEELRKTLIKYHNEEINKIMEKIFKKIWKKK